MFGGRYPIVSCALLFTTVVATVLSGIDAFGPMRTWPWSRSDGRQQ
jgi:hypothetical protein